MEFTERRPIYGSQIFETASEGNRVVLAILAYALGQQRIQVWFFRSPEDAKAYYLPGGDETIAFPDILLEM